MNKTVMIPGIIMALMLIAVPALAAEGDTGLLSVDAVLATLADTTVEPIPAANDRVAAFQTQLDRYRQELPILSDEAAGRGWGELFKSFNQLNAQPTIRSGYIVQPPDMDVLWDVLPGPRAWQWIAADTENENLQLIGAVLTNDRNAIWQGILAAAAAKPGRQDYERMQIQQVLSELLAAFSANCDDPDSLAAALDLQLRLHEMDTRAVAAAALQGYYQELKLPDVVAIFGPARGAEIIRQALRLPYMLEVPAGSETHRLAMRLALMAETAALAAPQWKLAASPDGFALYERCAAQFPDCRVAEWQGGGEARGYYAFGLAARGRMAEALASMNKVTVSEHYMREPCAAMVRDGHAAEARQFLRELLTRRPILDLWDLYATRAFQDGHGEEFIELAERTLTDTLPNRAHIARFLLNALLAENRFAEAYDLVARAADWSIDDEDAPELSAGTTEHAVFGYATAELAIAEALAIDTEAADTATASADTTVAPDTVDEEEASEEDMFVTAHMANQQNAHNLCSLGELAVSAGELIPECAPLLGRLFADLRRMGAEMVANGYKIMRNATKGNDGNSQVIRIQVARFLLEHNRPVEAQAEVIAYMRAKAQAQRMTGRQSGMQMMANEELLFLADIYLRAGQWQQVLALYDTAPVWSDTDAATMLWRHTYFNQQAAYTLAAALAQAGRREEALQAVRYLLAYAPGSDSGYALLLELNPPGLSEYLDARYARDQFEERPLIWKARYLMRQGNLSAAEASVRKAIEVDPTDGDQFPGNRVLAYAILRDILNLRGDTVNAAAFAALVTAVREAEEADRWRNAGLAPQSLRLYEQALSHFADAYCIQARLAMQLGRAGRDTEAAEHFQRAFELLPGQVGRMEDLCFGCEQNFGGEAALPIADAVFSRLHREQPANPRVAYLLGNLRVEQERYAEAAALYRNAVALDTDYLNAWVKLNELNDEMWLPASERRNIVQQLVRLNPSVSHISFDADDVNDPALTWQLAEIMAHARQDTFVYMVHAAPRPQPSDDRPEYERMRTMMLFRSQVDSRFVPRQALRSLPAMRALDSWLEMSRNRQMMGTTFFHSVSF